MAEDNTDDILVRLDEIEKLQTELRHLVPRVTNSSSRHARYQDLSHDSPASIRFPSLFTFPVISNSTSTPKNERLQKSAAQLNLINKSLNGNRHSTINLKNAGGTSQSKTFSRDTKVTKDLLRNHASSQVRNSSASTSIVNSRTSTRSNVANQVTKNPQESIRIKRSKKESSKTATKDKTQRATDKRSTVQLSRNENVNSSEWRILWTFIHFY